MNALLCKGIVFDIQRYSIHDGPGIRTTVFVKGCPLACKWCSNPESQTTEPIVMLNATNCLHCGVCKNLCAQGAIDYSLPGYINRTLCTNCGKCVAVCIARALVFSGKIMTVFEVLQEIKKDAVYYRRSNGGITVSGGEPLGQFEFVAALLEESKKHGWNTAIETAGYGSQESIEKIMPYVDLALLDIKQMSTAQHLVATGVTNNLILHNAFKIAQSSKQTIIRIPLIPDFNADEESIRRIVDFVKHIPTVEEIHLLPYHKLGVNKYMALGREYYNKELLAQSELETFKRIITKGGFSASIGGI
jgi:pyruvate formate lyase activating enzyme